MFPGTYLEAYRHPSRQITTFANGFLHFWKIVVVSCARADLKARFVAYVRHFYFSNAVSRTMRHNVDIDVAMDLTT